MSLENLIDIPISTKSKSKMKKKVKMKSNYHNPSQDLNNSVKRNLRLPTSLYSNLRQYSPFGSRNLGIKAVTPKLKSKSNLKSLNLRNFLNSQKLKQNIKKNKDSKTNLFSMESLSSNPLTSSSISSSSTSTSSSSNSNSILPSISDSLKFQNISHSTLPNINSLDSTEKGEKKRYTTMSVIIPFLPFPQGNQTVYLPPPSVFITSPYNFSLISSTINTPHSPPTNLFNSSIPAVLKSTENPPPPNTPRIKINPKISMSLPKIEPSQERTLPSLQESDLQNATKIMTSTNFFYHLPLEYLSYRFSKIPSHQILSPQRSPNPTSNVFQKDSHYFASPSSFQHPQQQKQQQQQQSIPKTNNIKTNPFEFESDDFSVVPSSSSSSSLNLKSKSSLPPPLQKTDVLVPSNLIPTSNFNLKNLNSDLNSNTIPSLNRITNQMMETNPNSRLDSLKITNFTWHDSKPDP